MTARRLAWTVPVLSLVLGVAANVLLGAVSLWLRGGAVTMFGTHVWDGPGMTRHGKWLALLTAALAGALAACGGGESAPDEARARAQADTAPTIQASFDVGGHELHLTCHGRGAPTVIYLHGYIHDPSGGGAGNAGKIPALLDDRVRVCVYDRANVGKSGSVKGRQTARDSVEDLHALLAKADLPGPYVLVGASFGGLIAQLYAGTYPADVAGMVLLDAGLPEDVEIDRMEPVIPERIAQEVERVIEAGGR